MSLPTVLITAGLPLVSMMCYFLSAMYQHRSRINRLREQGIAMPEWSWFTGHLSIMNRYVDRQPANANVYLAMNELARQYASTEIFLMDIWPIFSPILMVSGPELAVQATVTYTLPKPTSLAKGMKPIIGGPSILTMNNEEWKTWRGLLNPGFSPTNMMDLVPAIIDSVQVFCDILHAKVNTGLFQLDNLTMSLTLDVITKLTLDTDLDNQRSEHLISHCFRTVLAWHSFYDPLILLNPLRPFVQKYYWHRMNNFIQNEIQKRFSEMKNGLLAGSEGSHHGRKSVISLALREYFKQKDQISINTQLDKQFADIMGNQIRLFIMAGNHTSSSAIVYIYYLLSKHPDALSRIRAEHDTVFGKDKAAVADIIRETPSLLNKCRFTLAVIKETLRLFPPSSSIRQGRAGTSITDQQGNVYPTEGLDLTIMHVSVHTNPRIWPRPTEFLPERWLVDPGHELYVAPNSGNFRPFEQGPRSCIGQALVYNEIRVVLAMTIRTFDITPMYDDWDAAKLKNESRLSKLFRRVGLGGSKNKITVNGERAYQTNDSGAHPADGFPCRVALSDYAPEDDT